MGEFKTDSRLRTEFLLRLLEIDRQSELAEMMSGIAHELNQPLAAMATFSQAGARMLDRPDPLTSRSLEVFRDISREALQAGTRLQAVRRLFELDPPQPSQCAMAELIAEVRPILESLAIGIDAQLRVEVPAELPEVYIDRVKVQRVLLALVRNAVEASEGVASARMIGIDVRSARYDIETGITDSGVGVASDMKSRLFQPFFTTKVSGRGLGLASCRAIVESHGGTIGFDNIETGGVRFWFKLPVASS
jgi:signal transduction histidine kinase